MIGQTILIGFSLLAWGWLSDSWLVAGGLLLIVFLCRMMGRRWEISPMQFIRIGDLTSLLAILLLVDAYFIRPVVMPIFVLLKWLPLLFAPLLIIQLVSKQQQLPLATLFYALRKPWLASVAGGKQSDGRHVETIDFSFPFAGLTMLAAGAANVQTSVYFVLATALFAGMLWMVRPLHSSMSLWLLNIGLALFLSYHGYRGLYDLNSLLEEKSLEWLSRWHADPFFGRTSIGDVGDLKLSDKIEFRVKADGPLLLHQVSFDLYSGQYWIASARRFLAEAPKPAATTQKLKKLDFYQNMAADTLLALPDGTSNISGLELAELQYSEMGAVKVSLPAQFSHYQVWYDGRRIGEPGRFDLQLPKQHLDWLQQYAERMQLTGQPPKSIAENIQRYFQQHFYYSLYLGKENDTDNAIRHFMQESHAGHCEYYAAATVFLLRYAGVPARLANGYSVSEYDPDQDLYIVRRRHAHAWALAYIDGEWRPVDSTPWQWLDIETDNAGWLQPIADWWSNAVFSFRLWQQQPEHGHKLLISAVIATLLIVYLLWRFFTARQRQTDMRQAKTAVAETSYPGFDSELYLIEQTLQNTPLAKQTHESMRQWAERLQIPELQALIELHDRLRFDPVGLKPLQRQVLRERSAAYLARFRRQKQQDDA